MHTDARFIADELLFKRGEFDPIEFLLAAGMLDEYDYRQWRSGGRADLESALLCPAAEAVDSLKEARAYLLKQGLASVPNPADEVNEPRLGSSQAFTALCASRLRPSSLQSDLFQDSAVTIAEQAMRTALGAHRLDEAREILAELQSLGAETRAYRTLLQAIESSGGAPIAVADRLRELQASLTPLASRYLSDQAQRFLAPFWRALAERLRGTPFTPATPELHASYAYAKAGDWPQVLEAIEQEADWQRHHLLIARLAEACARVGQRARARQLWARLCWQFPQQAAAALVHAPGDPVLARRWREFSDLDPELPVQDFPVWLLIADLRQRELLPGEHAPADACGAAYAAMYRLLFHPGDIATRAAVNGYNKDLLGHYLRRHGG